MKKMKVKPEEKVWDEFKESQHLTSKQLEQFQKYQAILSEWNKNMNLTAIKDFSGVIRQHFVDSLALYDQMDLNKITTMADIGTGAGFPIIPLKIIYPHLKILLLEVNNKRQKFLGALITILELKNTQIIDLDWRTFLRKTDEDIDLFVTRAALNDLELIRMFKPACPYKNSTLIYWASDEWQPYKKSEPFVKEIKTYKLGKKRRKLVFMGLEK